MFGRGAEPARTVGENAAAPKAASAACRKPRRVRAGLLVAQGFDGVHVGGADGGVDAEHDADKT